MNKKQIILFLIFMLIVTVLCAIGTFAPAPLFFKIGMFIGYTALLLTLSFIAFLLLF